MTMALSVRGVRKSFEGREVLHGVDLDVARGEVLAIVGPSGAGKTTLLRILAMLVPPDAGQVEYDGATPPADARAALALRRRIGMVAQNPFLFRGSVFYNVSYGLCARGVDGPELTVSSLRALDGVGLADRLNAAASGLSAGEAQRVAFARAVVVRPDLLLLDEFAANLDPANVRILEDAVRGFARSTGATVVVVTHNMFQAKRIAQRVALLMDGGIVEAEPVDAFFESPRDARTRAFVRGEIAY